METLEITKEIPQLVARVLLYAIIILGTWLMMGLSSSTFANAPEWMTFIATFVLVWLALFVILCVHRFL